MINEQPAPTVTIPLQEYTQLLLKANRLKDLLGIRTTFDRSTIVVDIAMMALSDEVDELFASSPFVEEYVLEWSGYWINPHVYVGTKRNPEAPDDADEADDPR